MRRFLTVVATSGGVVLLLLLGFAYYVRPLASAAEPVFLIEHDIEIDASADDVWTVLTDFGAYPEWNPYALGLEGELAVGETIELTIKQSNWADPLTLRPKLVRVEAPRALGWHGTVLFDGLHETDHYFEIEPLPHGRSRLHHAEEFRGWLPARMNTEEQIAPTRNAFRAMNEALAVRAEALSGRAGAGTTGR